MEADTRKVVVKDVPIIAWRLQLGSAFVPAVPLLSAIYLCPESPKWLIKHGKYERAYRSYVRLRRHPIIAARDFFYTLALYELEAKQAAGTSYFSRLKDCFTVPRIRRANLAATVVMLAQQMSGINSECRSKVRNPLCDSAYVAVMAFYSSTVFREGGASVDQALYASLGFGAVNFLFAIPALWMIDTFGRRNLLLSVSSMPTVDLLIKVWTED